ncbi:MAG TPA: MotA/TolQ/ExbB proton channel family protein [Bacteroidetes bacterium]|nr:MotA/TolQ/ExbB proton channel family protein [Bacteroidota bacterium]
MASDFFQSFNPATPGYQFMWILLAMFVWMLALAIERLISIYGRANVNAVRFMNEVKKMVQAGDYKKAINLCKSAGARALPRVVLAALEEAEKRELIDYRAVQNAIDEKTLEIIPELQKRTNFLAMIGNVSTLTGLMGTIFGLIVSFKAAGQAGGGTGELAQGISIAMMTTLSGLIVAIPAIVLYTFINTKTNRIIEDIDEHSVKLIHLLTGGR